MGMDGRPHTQFAMKAVGLADFFKADFQADRVRGDVEYRPELAAPDGPSTGGGKQAVQHIRLVPFGRGTVITAGWANLAERRAEVRTFRYLAVTHAQRFKGQPIPIAQASYDELSKKLQAWFTQQGFVLTILDAPEGAVVGGARGGKPSAGVVALVVGIALAVAGAVSFLLLRG
jgi:hypothetical protein